MITKVEKGQQETLELYNSMKLKSDTFRDNFKLNKRIVISRYLWRLQPRDFIWAMPVSGFWEDLGTDKRDPYEDIHH